MIVHVLCFHFTSTNHSCAIYIYFRQNNFFFKFLSYQACMYYVLFNRSAERNKQNIIKNLHKLPCHWKFIHEKSILIQFISSNNANNCSSTQTFISAYYNNLSFFIEFYIYLWHPTNEKIFLVL